MQTREAPPREVDFFPDYKPHPSSVLGEAIGLFLAPNAFDPTLEACFEAGHEDDPDRLPSIPAFDAYCRDRRHGAKDALFAIKLGALCAQHAGFCGALEDDHPSAPKPAEKKKRQAIRLRKVTK